MRSIGGYKLFALVSALGAIFLYWMWSQGEKSNACHHLSSVNLPITTKQIIFVQPIHGVKAQITVCEWNNVWHATTLFPHSIAAVIGKKGVATIGSKREGDLRTPAGLYPIQWTFGTIPLALKMDYRYISEEDKFIDDPAHKDYNTWVNGTTNAQSYEPMRIPLYKMGAVVDYNMNPIVPGAGSAIFLHLWRSASQGTAGCIAMSERHLLPLLQWLDKKHHPYIYITDLHYKE